MIPLRRALPFLGAIAFLAGPVVLAQSNLKRIADYQVGDLALSNIVTAGELVVIDREASALLRQREAAKIPALVRHDPRAAEEAVRNLRAQFSLTRDRFILELAARFGQRQLAPRVISAQEFRDFRAAFQGSNKGFAVTPRLGSEWAAGRAGEEVEQQAIARLKEALAPRIRPDEWPAEVRDGPFQVRVIEVAPGEPLPPVDGIEKTGVLVGRQTIPTVTKVRNELKKRDQPAPERALGVFLASLVEPNCVVEVEATRQLRACRTADLWSADRYAAGSILVRAGETITARQKVALDQLAAQTAVTDLRRAPFQPVRYSLLVIISVSTGLVIAGLVVLFLTRRLEPRVEAIMVQTGAVLPAAGAKALLGPGEGTAISQAAREAARPHLENALKDKLVTELLSQRKDLIDAHQQAEADLAALEHRLAELHAPLQARLDAYERRIGELEGELASRGDENKELINATIVLMKQKLEAEKSGGRVKLN